MRRHSRHSAPAVGVAADCGHAGELEGLRARVRELEDAQRRDQKMARALSGSPRACLVADADDGFRLFYANPAGEAVFDQLSPWLLVPRDKVMGSRIDEVLGIAEFAPSALGSLRTSVSGVFKVGEEWVDMYLAPVLDAAGRLTALFMAGSLVTKRRQLAEAIAAESEEMRASIAEIARNAQHAATTATDAARSASAANATVAKLGQSSAEIASVVGLIKRIADQTRLLALNATIEAARVGDAGKGFAVVASEVKQLAQETAQATKQIEARIEGVQAQSRDAIDAITKILEVVTQIDEAQAAIASAVEEQTATASELSRHLVDNMA